MMSRQPLFRAQALQHYARGREKTVLPRFVALPVLLCLWLLLGLLLLTTALAWRIQAQRYARAEGALLSSPGGQQHATDEVQAILFVPTTPKMTRQGSGWRGWPPYCMWMMLPYARRLTPPFRPPRHMTLRLATASVMGQQAIWRRC